MGWQDLKSVRQPLVGNEDSALRDALEECAHPCLRRQSIVLSQNSALSAATITRFVSRDRSVRYCPSSPTPGRRCVVQAHEVITREASRHGPCRFSTFLLNALVGRVNRRMLTRMVKFS